MAQMPDIALTAVPGRRRWTLDLAKEIERRGFGGVYCPSFGDGLGLCEAIALETTTLRMGTSIAIIYSRNPFDYAQTASLIHEVSDGRFTFGIGVSHGTVHERLNLTVGKPLTDMRLFVQQLRAGEPQTGPLPPVVLATLRDKMLDLASEIAEGAVWANAARSRMQRSLERLTPEQRGGNGGGAPVVGGWGRDNAPKSNRGVGEPWGEGQLGFPNSRGSRGSIPRP